MNDELALGRLKLVVVVQHLAADELLELGRIAEPVDPELALDQLTVGVGPVARHAVDTERGHLAGHVDLAVVHRVAQIHAGVAADDLAASLHHEPGVDADIAEHDDRAAFLIDARARTHIAFHDEVAAADGGTGQRPGAALDGDDARHHVLGHRPADTAVDGHLWPVDEPAGEPARAALKVNAAALQDPDRQRVLRGRIQDGDVGDAVVVDELAQRHVDLPDGQIGCIEARPAAVHLDVVGHLGMGLDQAPGVVGDAAAGTYTCHTSTSRS